MLQAVFVVVGIEQTQLSLAVNSIKDVVDIKHDLHGRAFEGIAVSPDPLMPHLDKTARIGHVFHAWDCGPGTQRSSGFGGVLQRGPEGWIMA